ncbi:agamous-like MADS-box protein AGL80 [Magnolia sinica]|uniref:agamous-like MADS-box protein AGL80 n=1 Tax=Magnolia sinica TaxID=86752 RepID=UPI00265AD20D|nr:agamous-like MADS-box protein AGL80 [Magnolia sinica]
MGHNKLPLKVIRCDKHRKSAFSKRIKGLKKKAAELATLCGIDVCMVCCDPNGDPLETWPGSRSEVIPIIERYKKITETGRKGSITDVCSVLEDKIKKLQRDLDRQQAENNKLILYPSRDHRLDGMSEGYLRELVGQLDMKLEKLRGRIEMVKSSSDKRRLNMQTEQELVKEDCNAPLPLSYVTPLHHIHTSSQNLGFDIDMVQNEQEHVVEEDCNAPSHLSHLPPFYHLQTNSQNLGFDSDMVQNEQEHVVEEDCNEPPHLSYLTRFYHLHTYSQNLGIDSDMVGMEQEHVVVEDCGAPLPVSYHTPLYHLHMDSQNLGFNSDMGSEMPILNGNIMSGNSYDWMVGFQDFKTNECGTEILLPTSNELEYTGFPLLGLEPQDSVGLLNIEQMEYENDTSFQIPNRALGSWNSLASFR